MKKKDCQIKVDLREDRSLQKQLKDTSIYSNAKPYHFLKQRRTRATVTCVRQQQTFMQHKKAQLLGNARSGHRECPSVSISSPIILRKTAVRKTVKTLMPNNAKKICFLALKILIYRTTKRCVGSTDLICSSTQTGRFTAAFNAST